MATAVILAAASCAHGAGSWIDGPQAKERMQVAGFTCSLDSFDDLHRDWSWIQCDVGGRPHMVVVYASDEWVSRAMRPAFCSPQEDWAGLSAAWGANWYAADLAAVGVARGQTLRGDAGLDDRTLELVADALGGHVGPATARCPEEAATA